MSALFNIVLFLEFLFHGYCVYVYCSSVFKEKKIKVNGLFIFLSFSVLEFIVYILIYNTPINMIVTILLTIIACIICFKAKVLLCFLHSFILAGLLAMIELISVPIVDFFISDNYLVTHNTQSEILSSTITKIIFFIVCNIIKKVSEIEINVTKSIWLFIVPIMSLICGLSITSLCNEKNGQIFDNVILVFSVSMLIINLVAFGVHESYVKKVNETEKMKLLEQKKELDYEHYKLLQMEYNNSRAIIHDMKHHINTISAFVDNKDEKGLKKYIDSLRKQNQKFSGQVYTGNKIIDIIIYQKFEVSRKAGIDFIFKSNNITLDFIDEVDICCILSNLIDNAIESAQKSENKKIELIFYSNEQKTIYFIEIVNSCDFAPIVKNGTMITNKSDKRYHGVGLYSVEQTLKNYSGYISYLYDNDNHIFKTTVTIGK